MSCVSLLELMSLMGNFSGMYSCDMLWHKLYHTNCAESVKR